MNVWEHIADPEARTHGAAWSAYHATLMGQHPTPANTVRLRREWLIFLAGWKAKCDQRAGFRSVGLAT